MRRTGRDGMWLGGGGGGGAMPGVKQKNSRERRPKKPTEKRNTLLAGPLRCRKRAARLGKMRARGPIGLPQHNQKTPLAKKVALASHHRGARGTDTWESSQLHSVGRD